MKNIEILTFLHCFEITNVLGMDKINTKTEISAKKGYMGTLD